MPGPMKMDFSFGKAAAPQPAELREGDSPRRILVLADLSARASRGLVQNLSDRPIAPVDVDNLDQVLFRYAPTLAIAREDGGDPFQLSISSIEDFHPDQLFAKVGLLEELRGLRSRLSHPSTFEAASREIQQRFGGGMPAAEAPAAEASTPSEPAGENPDDLFERLLGAPQQTPTVEEERARPGGIDVSAFVRDLVKGDDVVPAPGPERDQYIAMVDEVTGGLLRAILHHPDFQDLERAWRSVEWLAHRCDSRDGIQLRVLDVSAEELASDFAAAGGDPRATALSRLLGDAGAGSNGAWSLVIADLSFGSTPDDLSLLGALGALSASFGAPFVAGASPRLLGVDRLVGHGNHGDWSDLEGDLARRWQMLRSSSVAAWIGLGLPRFLLRMPYGRTRDPVESFAFEEIAGEDEHEQYLWANPGFAIASSLIAAATKDGDEWFGVGGNELVVDDLPAVAVERGGVTELLPGAEEWISDESGLVMLSRGLIPLMSRREANEVRLMGLRSLSDPPRDLSIG